MEGVEIVQTDTEQIFKIFDYQKKIIRDLYGKLEYLSKYIIYSFYINNLLILTIIYYT